MKMFAFYLRNHTTWADGEEVVVAHTQQEALKVLNAFYEKDNFQLNMQEAPVKQLDQRGSFSFEYGDTHRISEYLKNASAPHFVGSSSPDMANIAYLLLPLHEKPLGIVCR